MLARGEVRPITVRGLAYAVKRYADLAKVEDLSCHDLRHRFGYRMAERVPLHRLAQIMGHDSLDTTMVYVKGTQGRPPASRREDSMGLMDNGPNKPPPVKDRRRKNVTDKKTPLKAQPPTPSPGHQGSHAAGA